MNSITRLGYLSSRLHSLKHLIFKRQSSFQATRGQLAARQDSLWDRTDFLKTSDTSGFWKYIAHSYSWHGFEYFSIQFQCICWIIMLFTFVKYGWNKVEIVVDRSWKGGNRPFIWHAIEDRFDPEYACVVPYGVRKLSKLSLMRTLQKEMWAASVKKGTWLQDSRSNK